MSDRVMRERDLRQTGTSLVVLLVAVALAIVLVGGAGMVVLKSGEFFDEQVKILELEQAGRRATERLSEELMGADPETVLPVLMADSDVVQFKKVIGYSGGAPQHGPLITIRFQLAEGETQNSQDDNGDGRVDEGGIFYVEDGKGPVGIVSDVLGLRINPIAGGLSYSLDVGKFDSDGYLKQRSFTEEVAFRN